MIVQMYQPPIDPFRFKDLLWPDVYFYPQQREIIQSVVDNRETVVVAGNKLGKDFVAGFVVLWFFCTRYPVRIVTTSAKDDHLRVLWGEIGRFIDTAAYPLEHRKGGLLIVNQREMRVVIDGGVDKVSYCRGMVASPDKMAAMQGHHAGGSAMDPHSMFVCDEASSVPGSYYTMADTWMDRSLIFGNAWPCENFFKHAVKGNPKTRDAGGDLAWA